MIGNVENFTESTEIAQVITVGKIVTEVDCIRPFQFISVHVH